MKYGLCAEQLTFVFCKFAGGTNDCANQSDGETKVKQSAGISECFIGTGGI
jgi:hypothetical protein